MARTFQIVLISEGRANAALLTCSMRYDGEFVMPSKHHRAMKELEYRNKTDVGELQPNQMQTVRFMEPEAVHCSAVSTVGLLLHRVVLTSTAPDAVRRLRNAVIVVEAAAYDVHEKQLYRKKEDVRLLGHARNDVLHPFLNLRYLVDLRTGSGPYLHQSHYWHMLITLQGLEMTPEEQVTLDVTAVD